MGKENFALIVELVKMIIFSVCNQSQNFILNLLLIAEVIKLFVPLIFSIGNSIFSDCNTLVIYHFRLQKEQNCTNVCCYSIM